jgi:hypothetical protein
LSRSAATTHGDDLVRVIQIHTFDLNGLAQDLRRERAAEMLLEHGQERHTLLGLAVRIDERFFDEFIETGLRESARREAFPRLGCAASHAEMIAGLRWTYVGTRCGPKIAAQRLGVS